jgi:hypothetical protein
VNSFEIETTGNGETRNALFRSDRDEFAVEFLDHCGIEAGRTTRIGPGWQGVGAGAARSREPDGGGRHETAGDMMHGALAGSDVTMANGLRPPRVTARIGAMRLPALADAVCSTS